ncbi:MAG: hypothetical protein UZ08_BCD001001778 [Candidatus Parvibacillus calidus]|nr:MAG: hypothetical protein UZ08_BCD001001778 [Candidatus Parvibacillus calidus]
MLLSLKSRHIFLKEVFEFRFGEQTVNNAEDGFFIFIIKLINKS